MKKQIRSGTYGDIDEGLCEGLVCEYGNCSNEATRAVYFDINDVSTMKYYCETHKDKKS